MNDLGGKLRQAREGRGISLAQLAASTKISLVALDALERNEVSKLPGGIFSRSFVRSYAVEVGLDPDETVNDFDRVQETPPPPARVAQVPEEELAFERRQRLAARVFLIAVAVMIICAGVIVYLLLQNRPAGLG